MMRAIPGSRALVIMTAVGVGLVLIFEIARGASLPVLRDTATGELQWPCETDLECEMLDDQADAAGCFGLSTLAERQACLSRVAREARIMAGGAQ